MEGAAEGRLRGGGEGGEGGNFELEGRDSEAKHNTTATMIMMMIT